MITTLKAIEIFEKNIKEKANREHCLIVGYGMKALAKHFKEDKTKQEYWFIVGLLHDIDIEKYKGDINKHCIIGEKILQLENIDQEIINIIKTHNDALKIKRIKKIEHALYASDALSGIIRAYVLMRPDKDIQQTKVSSIIKKIKDKSFASNISRKEIYDCENKLEININKFIEITLNEIKENMKFTG